MPSSSCSANCSNSAVSFDYFLYSPITPQFRSLQLLYTLEIGNKKNPLNVSCLKLGNRNGTSMKAKLME